MRNNPKKVTPSIPLNTEVPSARSISARSNGIDASIRTIDKRREEMERRLVDVEARMRAQFTALDTLLGKMQTTSTFLAQQLAKLDAETK